MSHLYDSSFYSARNIVISACLMVVFTLLLALATFLATKYRRKTVVSYTFQFPGKRNFVKYLKIFME